MRIAVLLKEVPDTWGARSLDLETGLAVRTSGEPVLDEITERAMEAALSLADGQDIQVLSMGPASAGGSLRKGLAMGAASAVQVVDDALVGADLTLTAEVLAAAVRHGQYDLVVAGNLSTDGSGGVIPAMLAELLGWPHLTQLVSLNAEGDTLTARRASDDGTMDLSAPLPAVVSITEAFPDARFPNFKGLMAAKKKPLETLSLADLGIEAEDFTVPRAIMTAVAERPPRQAGVKVVDDGDAAAQLAAYLVENRL